MSGILGVTIPRGSAEDQVPVWNNTTGRWETLSPGANDEVLSVNAGVLDYRKVVSAMVDFTFAAWTPQLTASTSNPTLGTGAVQTGGYVQLGKLVAGYAYIQFGTAGTAAGSGDYLVSRPVNSVASRNFVFGCGNLTDASTGADRPMTLSLSSASKDAMRVAADGTDVSEANPWAWAASDRIVWFFVYEAA